MIGPYRIEREIARGGMGIVYLAHDTRLDRTVALKALPTEVASDPERLSRFEREAKLLASLNDPSIGAIYDIAEGEGRRYLALEHIEGETLAQRLTVGALPVSESIEICLQIASGMEAAHERGVIHRDLKPGNVMITPGDRAKVVDFGLAKGRPSPDSDLAHSPTFQDEDVSASSPTVTSPADPPPGTVPGVILGTAPYLSPEQARGKIVDRRTDIWSLGCILYECLTGRKAFQGETVSDTVARILERDPDWSLLPKATPFRLRELLERCLEKDPRKRLRDIGDARLMLEEARNAKGAGQVYAPDGVAATKIHGPDARLSFALGLVLGGTLALLLWGVIGRGSVARRGILSGPIHVSIPIPPDLDYSSAQITPDGRSLVLIVHPPSAAGQAPRPRIYVRRLDRMAFEPVPGTEASVGFIVSPDSRWIGFAEPLPNQTVGARLYKVPIDGSAPPVAWIDIDFVGDGIAWLNGGDLVVSISARKEYVRLNGSTGARSKPRPLEIPGLNGQVALANWTLPGDRGLLLKISHNEAGTDHQGIGVLDLRSGRAKILVRDGGNPRYISTGHLLFTSGSTLLAAPFDVERLELKGEPSAVMGELRIGPYEANADFTIASNGTLLHTAGGAAKRDRHLVLVSPGGAIEEWSAERRTFGTDLSPSYNGSRLAATVKNAKSNEEIWISERGQPFSRKVVATAGADCGPPIFSPDGARIAYAEVGGNGSGVRVASLSGDAPPRLIGSLLTSPEEWITPTSWSPDGSSLLCTLAQGRRRSVALLEVDAAGRAGSEPKILFGGEGTYGPARFSPDGRWIAYRSDETGSRQAFVREYRLNGTLGPPIQISSDGIRLDVLWRQERQLAYCNQQGRVMLVQLQTKPQLTVSPPSEFCDHDGLGIVDFDFLRDGRMVAIQEGSGWAKVDHLDLTLNFFDELRSRIGRRQTP